MKVAFFGDENNLGAIEKINEMHAVFTSTKWTGKILLGFFGGIGVITGAVIGVIELIKRLR